jgi:hypothetical protein
MVATMAQKRMTLQLYTTRFQRLTQLRTHRARAIAIDNEAHTQTLTRLATEDVCKESPRAVAGKDVVLHVDCFARTLQIGNERTEYRRGRDKQLLGAIVTLWVVTHRNNLF